MRFTLRRRNTRDRGLFRLCGSRWTLIVNSCFCFGATGRFLFRNENIGILSVFGQYRLDQIIFFWVGVSFSLFWRRASRISMTKSRVLKWLMIIPAGSCTLVFPNCQLIHCKSGLIWIATAGQVMFPSPDVVGDEDWAISGLPLTEGPRLRVTVEVSLQAGGQGVAFPSPPFPLLGRFLCFAPRHVVWVTVLSCLLQCTELGLALTHSLSVW